MADDDIPYVRKKYGIVRNVRNVKLKTERDRLRLEPFLSTRRLKLPAQS